MALPFNRFQMMDFVNGELSMGKTMAFRMLNFENAIKVGMRFKRRWWEDPQTMEGRPIQVSSKK